jgi:hypothetical protein
MHALLPVMVGVVLCVQAHEFFSIVTTPPSGHTPRAAHLLVLPVSTVCAAGR